MSKLAMARAEAARLFLEERLEVAAIAERMARSVEGVELLLKHGGVDPSAPRAAPPPAVDAPAPAQAKPAAVRTPAASACRTPPPGAAAGRRG